MKRKRWTAVLLIFMFAVLSLSGCSGSKNGEDKTAKETGQKGAVQEKTAASKTYNGQDVSEPVELVLYYIGDIYKDQDKVLAEVNKILKEKINATLTLKNIAMSDYATKYSLAMAGGEKMDLIYTSTWAFYQQEATKGAFAEVTDEVLKDYMPLTNENQAKASFGQAKINGKVFFVPGNMANVNANAILIRGDLREKYGLAPLKSIDDLQSFYKAVASDPDSGVSFAYDASQNNDTSKLIFYFGANNYIQLAGSLQNYVTYKYGDSVTSDDLFWIYDRPEYLDYAKRMKEWADNGAWSKSAIANATDVKEAFLNGTSASYSQNLGTVGATASQVVETHPEWKPEIYDLTPDADRFLSAYTGDGCAVLAYSENKERAFMALDVLKFDKTCYNLLRHGIEDVHYSMTEDGYWKPEAASDSWPFGNAVSWGFKNSMYETTRADTFADQVKIGDDWTARAVDSPTAAFSFDDSKVKNELASLQSVYTQYVPLLDLGLVSDVDSTLAEFQKQAKAAGLDRVLEEAKAQLDVFFREQ